MTAGAIAEAGIEPNELPDYRYLDRHNAGPSTRSTPLFHEIELP
jgi:hypothetical protein